MGTGCWGLSRKLSGIMGCRSPGLRLLATRNDIEFCDQLWFPFLSTLERLLVTVYLIRSSSFLHFCITFSSADLSLIFKLSEVIFETVHRRKSSFYYSKTMLSANATQPHTLNLGRYFRSIPPSFSSFVHWSFMFFRLRFFDRFVDGFLMENGSKREPKV
jgi:hypothetical protein